MSASLIVRLPDVGSTNPAMARNKVVLPQPEGPKSVKNSFARIVTLMSFNAVNALAPEPKVLDSSAISIIQHAPFWLPQQQSDSVNRAPDNA